MNRLATALALLAPALYACSTEGVGRDSSVSVTDSAGIQVIVHSKPASVDSVSGPPQLTIGREGDPNYEFFRVNGVLGLENGDLVVTNGGFEVRFYDANGVHLRTAGGSGDGPEEFGLIGAIFPLSDDSIAVVDTRRRRLVTLDRLGAFHGDRSLASVLGGGAPMAGMSICTPPGIAGVLEDGREVARGWACARSEGSGASSPIVFPLWIERSADTIGVLTMAEVWGQPRTTDPQQRIGVIPFTARPRPVVGGAHVYVAPGVDYRVEVFGSDGQMVSVLRETAPPLALVEAEITKYRAELEAGGRTLPSAMPFPDQLPAYQTLLISADGELWARHSSISSDGPQTWSVFSRDGTALRHVVIPEFDLMSVRDGKLYGVLTSDLGVQTPAVLTLSP